MIKEINGTNGKYSISDEGVVFSKYTGRELKLSTDRYGYKKCQLYINGERKLFSVHRLVYETFVGSIDDCLVIDHIDCNRCNNDVSNLRTLSVAENTRRGKKNNLGVQGVYKQRDKYIASICIDGKGHYLGSFSTIEEAKCVYENAKSKQRVNFKENHIRFVDHKVCNICREDKNISEFYKRKSGWIFYCCKECYKRKRK